LNYLHGGTISLEEVLKDIMKRSSSSGEHIGGAQTLRKRKQRAIDNALNNPSNPLEKYEQTKYLMNCCPVKTIQ